MLSYSSLEKTRNLITMRCSTLRGTFCSLITLATPRQDWTGSNPSRREGAGCGFTFSRSHSCCAVRLVYIQISPGHIWTTLYLVLCLSYVLFIYLLASASTASIFIQSLGQEQLCSRELMQTKKYWRRQKYSFGCNSCQSQCLKCVTLVETIQIASSLPKLLHHADFLYDDRLSLKLRLNCTRY